MATCGASVPHITAPKPTGSARTKIASSAVCAAKTIRSAPNAIDSAPVTIVNRIPNLLIDSAARAAEARHQAERRVREAQFLVVEMHGARHVRIHDAHAKCGKSEVQEDHCPEGPANLQPKNSFFANLNSPSQAMKPGAARRRTAHRVTAESAGIIHHRYRDVNAYPHRGEFAGCANLAPHTRNQSTHGPENGPRYNRRRGASPFKARRSCG